MFCGPHYIKKVTSNPLLIHFWLNPFLAGLKLHPTEASWTLARSFLGFWPSHTYVASNEADEALLAQCALREQCSENHAPLFGSGHVQFPELGESPYLGKCTSFFKVTF